MLCGKTSRKMTFKAIIGRLFYTNSLENRGSSEKNDFPYFRQGNESLPSTPPALWANDVTPNHSSNILYSILDYEIRHNAMHN